MTAESIAAIAGIVLSLAFSYIPGLKTWYDSQTPQARSLVMLGSLAVVSAAVFGLACAGFAADLGLPVTCDQAGAIGLVKAFIFAVIANQSTYSITKRIGR
jgi:hypothetical protein